jgi:hypothetical protein
MKGSLGSALCSSSPGGRQRQMLEFVQLLFAEISSKKEQLQELKPTRTLQMKSRKLHWKPKRRRRSRGDVRQKQRMLPRLQRLQVLPKVETYFATGI